ncbi:MAG: glycoside hydrolase family 13 protein, partial [Clostridia bacterium]|nr:glycoside hydrolase family 13 protein [Clostridia bacterium]
MKIPYFSRDPAYKTPFGAAKTGEDILFHLFLPLDCSQAFILFCKDGCGEINYRFWKTRRVEEDGCWWECLIRVEEPGLYYYRFTFDTPFGHNFLTCGAGGKALMNPTGGSFQLTVYDASFETPSWLRGGIVYQIFPD